MPTDKETQLTRSALRSSSRTPYLITFAVMLVITIAAIVLIAVRRPTQDNTSEYIQIVGIAGAMAAAVMALQKSQETHLSVNSRLEQFIRNADRSARAEGELKGRAESRAERPEPKP